MPRSGGQECDRPAWVARAGQLRAGDQLSCRVAECRGDLGEVGGHGGGLDAGEGLGLAGLVGVSDDGDPGQVPREAERMRHSMAPNPWARFSARAAKSAADWPKTSCTRTRPV